MTTANKRRLEALERIKIDQQSKWLKIGPAMYRIKKAIDQGRELDPDDVKIHNSCFPGHPPDAFIGL